MGAKSELKSPTSVVLTGTAKHGTPGLTIGHVDIGVSESAYLFRISLPGVRKDLCDLKCEVKRNGIVIIRGVITGGELAQKNPKTVYQMTRAQLNEPGPFSIYFKLPGLIDPRLFSPTFRSDGILEGVVMKYKAPGVPQSV